MCLILLDFWDITTFSAYFIEVYMHMSIYTVSQKKTRHYTPVHDFAKC